MNEIISNLFVLIPLAFLIAIRILQVRAQRKAGSQTKPSSYPRRVAQGERAMLNTTVGVREKRTMYPMAQEVATEFKEGQYVSGEEEQPPYESTGIGIPKESSPSLEKGRLTLERPISSKEEKHLSPLPEKVTKLSPWKQAVVLREILGPPKGF